jgi:hypothetical protein
MPEPRHGGERATDGEERAVRVRESGSGGLVQQQILNRTSSGHWYCINKERE